MAAGLPSAAGLTKHLRAARDVLRDRARPEIVDAIDRDIEWLAHVQDHLRPLLQHLKGVDPDNIEDVFRIWDTQQAQPDLELPGAPPKLVAGYQYRRLIRMLALALAHAPRYSAARDMRGRNIYSWLVEQLVGKSLPGEGGLAIVVTTNYDLLVEFAVAARADTDLSYLLRESAGLRNVFQREMAARGTLHYLKLHGSINWFGEGPGFRVSRATVRRIIDSDDPLADIAERYVMAAEDEHSFEMTPAAVLKDVMYRENWTDVWDEAHAGFTMCRRLAIIGYSFSSGDMLVNNMIALGLARSPHLETIVVIDPDARRVMRRLKEYFTSDFLAGKRWISHACRFDDDIMEWTSLWKR